MKDERIGKDVEGCRGSIGLLINSGVHVWTFEWQHEPSRQGTCDAFGLCSEAREDFTSRPTPYLGAGDSGASIAIYANGNMYHNDKLILQLPQQRVIEASAFESNSTSFPNISSDGKSSLFGKKSLIVCEFDTASNGGTLRITVDGVPLESATVSDVYEKLGGQEIFPCICLSPLDPNLVKNRKCQVRQNARNQAAVGTRRKEESECERDL